MIAPAIKPPDTFREANEALDAVHGHLTGYKGTMDAEYVCIKQELHDLKAALVMANKRIVKLSRCAEEFRTHGVVERCYCCHKYAPVFAYSADGSVFCGRECFARVERCNKVAYSGDVVDTASATGGGV